MPKTDKLARMGAARGRASTVVVVVVVSLLCAGVGILVGMRLARGGGKSGSAGQAAQTGELWTCSMHPQVIQDHPGLCPICHMELTPLKAAGAGTGGAVTIDPVVVQNMGVRTAVAKAGELKRSVRLVGYLEEAQPNIREVSVRVSGWISKLHAATEGMRVAAGDPLFDLYSQELQVAIGEMISGRKAREATAGGSASAAGFVEAASRRLTLWGLTRAQIDELAKLDRPPETVTFYSPVTGILTEKAVVEGAAVKAGDRVMRIVDYSMLWIDAQAFERDLPLVRQGQKARARIAALGKDVEGEVVFVSPRVEGATRTAMVRLSVPNPEGLLRPGMYSTVWLDAPGVEGAVVVPREAVIDTGERQVVLVSLGGGRFEPRDVKVGMSGDEGMVQVLEGVKAGEEVVTSGQFLIDSESRLKEAIQKYLHGKGAPIAVNAAEREKVDAVMGAYLELSGRLGEAQTSDAAVDPAKLVVAAHGLHGGAAGALAELGAGVATAAEGMKGKGIDEQREAFKKVSERVIALVERATPGEAAAEGVYLVYCPMAPGHWLQRGESVANPYYATTMKACGEVVRKLGGRH